MPQPKTMMIRGLTLFQPWAWAVAAGKKTIENRKWRPWSKLLSSDVEAWLAIHAGSTYELAGEEFLHKHNVVLPDVESRLKGVILGIGRLVGCVEESDHPMFFGPFGWQLGQLQLLEKPIPVKGQMGLWELQPAHEAFLRTLISQPTEPRQQMTLFR